MKKSNSRLEISTLSSKLLARKINYCAILPKDYDKTNRKFPVLYLLHGLFSRFDNWLTNTKILKYAQDLPFLIICPDGGDNWYSDNPILIKHFYESYIFQELIPEVESSFRIRGEKNARAIAGLSMGGYGAFKLAFRRPEMFCFAGSMSGAFHAAEIFDDLPTEEWKELRPSISVVFGNQNSKIRSENNLFEIVEKFPADKISALPYFYFDCGVKDEFLPINQRLAELFRRREIPHKFQEYKGGHDWIYWNLHLKNMLQSAARYF